MSAAATSANRVTVRAPAKINLELRVGPRRDDGYHDLATVFHAVSLYDEVTLTPSDDWGCTVIGPYAGSVPEGADNLALQAALLLAERVGDVEPVHVEIAKEIPVAGGMAGGSADAAAVLIGCDELWRLDTDRSLIEELAGLLGSDVNFALTGGTAIGSGRGERVAPVLGRGRYHWVLVISDDQLPTSAVYAECDRLRGESTVATPEHSAPMMTALRSGNARLLGEVMTNDLQAAALSLLPSLREVIDAGLEYGALGGVVSGSGPTVAFLVDGAEGSLDLAVALTASGVAHEVKRAVGPVHGAHVVPDLRT